MKNIKKSTEKSRIIARFQDFYFALTKEMCVI